jgi:hypothetical protein
VNCLKNWVIAYLADAGFAQVFFCGFLHVLDCICWAGLAQGVRSFENVLGCVTGFIELLTVRASHVCLCGVFNYTATQFQVGLDVMVYSVCRACSYLLPA